MLPCYAAGNRKKSQPRLHKNTSVGWNPKPANMFRHIFPERRSARGTHGRNAAIGKSEKANMPPADRDAGRKTPITAADLLNGRVLPFFDEKEVTRLELMMLAGGSGH